MVESPKEIRKQSTRSEGKIYLSRADSRDERGDDPLRYRYVDLACLTDRWFSSANKGDLQSIEFCLERRVDPNYEDIRGHNWTALTYAAAGGHGKVCRRLVEAGARLEKP